MSESSFSPVPAANTIIFVTHEFPPRHGGIATYVEQTARALAETGKVRVAVWKGGAELDGGAAGKYPFAVGNILNRGSLSWPCLWRTGRFLRQRRQQVEDATLCLPEPGPIFAYLYAGLLGLPWPNRLVLVLHGSEVLRLSSCIHRRVGFRKLLGRAAAIGVVSNYTGELLNRCFPGFADRVVLVPGAVRKDFPLESVRDRPVNAAGDLRVLTVGRMHPRKGFHHVIAALGALPEALKKRVTYTIVSPKRESRYRQRLISSASQLGVRLNCIQEDGCLSKIYGDADVFAMTSDRLPKSVEGFGLVYLEAGAAGLPVVAYDSGGVREAVWHNHTGWVVTPGDTAGLTQALHDLLTDETLRHRFGEAGRKRVGQLSWTANAHQLFPQELSGQPDVSGQ